MKRLLILILVLALLLCGCSGAADAGTEPTQTTTQPRPVEVGICLPSQDDSYWSACAGYLQTGLEKLGLQTRLQYADEDVQRQVEQVETMIGDRISCLVIAAVDSVALAEPLGRAKAAGIPVVALDRPMMDTDGVSFCVSFDYQAIGVAMGQYIEESMALETAQQEQRTHTVEFFMGSADDHNAFLLHGGVLSVLGPYLDSGVLICPSGRVSFEDSSILRWDGEAAGDALRRYLELYYTTPEGMTVPQICCAASDELALGCQQALEGTTQSWPLITGQGYGAQALECIEAGTQAMTAVKDVQVLCHSTLQAVQFLLEGKTPAADTHQNNHVMDVPTKLCAFRVEQGAAPEKVQTETVPAT